MAFGQKAQGDNRPKGAGLKLIKLKAILSLSEGFFSIFLI
jgi:hypothetical protein